ncbi:hypothetical protein [Oenococcus oeni]|uniref:hypothetical protein n=1 Tax=Oenococcus oeni TaxID=1247 RepID=UPI0008F826BF|nr:hypothetical protein [Oenococcus oeni]OIL67656.1 hypothetical protein ATX30_09465 [Oenococcus oeni]OIM48222.1 hypothetical protein ATX76_04275 [Oenococcus oeni]
MEIKNQDIIPVANFLGSLKLPAKVARGVAKFQKSLAEIAKDLSESEKDLVKQFGGSVDDQGRITWPVDLPTAQVDYQQAHKDLFDETAEIQSRYKEEFSVIKDYFASFDQDIDPQNLHGFDAFMDAFEPIEETKEAKK